MKFYHPIQRFIAAFLFLSLSLQSCMPALEPGSGPKRQGDSKELERFPSIAEQAHLLPADCLKPMLASPEAPITKPVEASIIFSKTTGVGNMVSHNKLGSQDSKKLENTLKQHLITNTGHALILYQDKDGWRAKVTETAGTLQRSEELPVVCAPGIKVETIDNIPRSQARHIVHRIKHPEQDFIYIGKMGLAGGMLEEEQKANPILAKAITLIRDNAITLLDLNNKQIGNQEVIALVEALKTNTAVTHLYLNHNQIGAEGAIVLAEALKTNTAITHVDLGDNNIGSEGTIALAEALKTNTAITNLYLGGNQIGSGGAIALAEALKTNTAIANLDLWRNQIGAEGAIALAEPLKTNTAITYVDLGGNQIGVEGAIALAEALKINTALTHLDLHYYNAIGAEGAIALAEALKTNTVLTHLYLARSQIGVEGGRALAEALKHNKALRHLYLGSNQIGAEGGRALANALKTNTVLTTLELIDNQIGAEGAIALADALRTNTALTNLYLSLNQIGIEGVIALAEALKANAAITILDLRSNQIGAEGARALAGGLTANTVITKLDLSGNAIEARMMREIESYTTNNEGLALYALGKNLEAIAYYDKALALNPNYANAYTNKENALYKLDKEQKEAFANNEILNGNNLALANYFCAFYNETRNATDQLYAHTINKELGINLVKTALSVTEFRRRKILSTQKNYTIQDSIRNFLGFEPNSVETTMAREDAKKLIYCRTLGNIFCNNKSLEEIIAENNTYTYGLPLEITPFNQNDIEKLTKYLSRFSYKLPVNITLTQAFCATLPANTAHDYPLTGTVLTAVVGFGTFAGWYIKNRYRNRNIVMANNNNNEPGLIAG